VRLSGVFPVSKGRLLTSTIRVSGADAASGEIRLGSSSTRVSGTLGGRRFDLRLAKVRLSRAGDGDGEWPAAAPTLSRLGREPTRGTLAAALPQLP
jgi:hypothetical protein